VPDLVRATTIATLCPWVHPCLTFGFDSGTADVAGVAEFQAVRDAMATWSAAVPVTFTEVGLRQRPDIVIGWRDPDLDLPGKRAHADFPPGCGFLDDTLPRPLHFNEEGTNWAIGRVLFSFDVESVALHELGHNLGLGHTPEDGPVMSTTLNFGSTRRVLTDQDLEAIRTLYPPIPAPGVVTIRQQSTDRMLDAHEIATKDFRLVTRPEQGNDTQRWTLTEVGSVNVIRQKTSGRFLEGSETAADDFRLVTRDPSSDEAQRWIVVPAGDGSVTIRQLSTNRFLDAHEIPERDFAAVTRPRQVDSTQRWSMSPTGPNTFTLQQRSSGRFLDAHEIAARDFAVVTRTAQADETQRWIFARVGTVYTLSQASNGRFVDAHEIGDRDFAVVSRAAQGDDTQRWVVVPTADGSCTVRQLSSGRFLDAYSVADEDFGAVTRLRSNHPAQRWLIAPA
jgi:hypothetical protein